MWGSKLLYALVVIRDPEIKIKSTDKAPFQLKNESSTTLRVKLKLDVGKFTKKESSYGILPSMGSLGIMGMVNNYHQLIHNNMKDTAHRKEDIEKINVGDTFRLKDLYNVKIKEKKDTIITEFASEELLPDSAKIQWTTENNIKMSVFTD